MYDPALLWRATDFWREGLGWRVRKDIKLYNQWHDEDTRKLPTYNQNYTGIAQADENKPMPANFFQDVTGWLWFVKEDGYLVSLSRDAQDKWSMHTRSGLKLTPPRGFLEGLEKSMSLPAVMVGELVTCFTGCDAADRADTGSRNVLRNQQFAIIHRVLERGADPLAWVGLRIKVFAFPNKTMDIWTTYNTYRDVMAATLHHHPHIGMCRAGKLFSTDQLHSTQYAINIFAHVVQMGLEGIVIVNPSVKYGTLDTLDDHHEEIGTFFKLKQKIVLPGRKFQKTGRTKDVSKDGKTHTEHDFTTTVDGQVVHFTDRIGKETAHARIKYMEHAPGLGDTFPCQSGYRHMHFAQSDDMNVMVPAERALTTDHATRNILGVDETVRRIRNWNVDADREALEKQSPLLRLFNPRPFRIGDILTRMEADPPVPKEHRKINISDGEEEQASAHSSQPVHNHPMRVEGRKVRLASRNTTPNPPLPHKRPSADPNVHKRPSADPNVHKRPSADPDVIEIADSDEEPGSAQSSSKPARSNSAGHEHSTPVGRNHISKIGRSNAVVNVRPHAPTEDARAADAAARQQRLSRHSKLKYVPKRAPDAPQDEAKRVPGPSVGALAWLKQAMDDDEKREIARQKERDRIRKLPLSEHIDISHLLRQLQIYST
jgi:hypothetical protein